MKRALTGDRPTGNLHIGHYLGSLVTRVNMQDDYELYIMIADVQALTDHYDNPQLVRDNVKQLLIDYLSIGIDPDKVTIFIQSTIPEIAELTVFYSNFVTVSRLQRNPTVKSEIAQKKVLFKDGMESVTYGFLGYPVSQAADITFLNAEVVPVGDDQLPMIEQSREIVRKFNSIYGEVLVIPEPLLSSNTRVKGLDGNSKMGKSLNNAIYLNDNSETVAKKVMAALTDPLKIRKNDPGHPDNCMVAYYHQFFSKPDYKTICDECERGARGCVDCKKQLITNLNKFLDPIREKRAYYEAHPEYLDQVLKAGNAKVAALAKVHMHQIRKAMKIDY